ncbi:DUF7344 domain-containing protein [Halorussus marinus]|uniref:DUF7344 domain-containing protein n=1 Tax=Halorussus marinus TaxID=2505976 RepID=UPI00106E5659|nr:hypothetical protein [Halorussus marinus]
MSHDHSGETDVSAPHAPMQDVLPMTGESERLDAVFRALADHRRRWVCHYLARRDGPASVDELAELLAASTTEKRRAVLTAAEIEKTRAELLQIHLPKLSEAGVLDHDTEASRVRFAADDDVEDVLGVASETDFK